MKLDDAVVDATAVSIASKTTWTGAVAGVAGWLSSVNWLGLIGALVAVSGLAVNVYFQFRRDRREARESEARIEALHDRCGL